MLLWRYHVEPLLDVPPEAFDPPPRVHSSVVRMTPWPQAEVLDPALLEAMMAAAFSMRRKLLRHSLGRWLDARGFAGHFDLQRRAEEVPVDEYLQLARNLMPPLAPGSPG
jgi:16S rRNA (adenine1518-N6/adenine1519-N6)-dimethyltransferase